MYPRVCIPSYGRPEQLMSKTLTFLQRQFYPRERINIFVASEEERQAYEVCGDYNIVVGVLGLVPQRNFISDWLDDDEIYVSLDDDVDGIKSAKPFIELVRDASQMLSTGRAGLWGVLPKDDARCFKDDTTEHLSFIVGAFFVARNHKDIRIQCFSEDYERTLIYFTRYGAVFRYRGAGVITKYRGTSGNDPTGFMRTKALAIQYLIERYPDACSYRDKNGEPDLLLNWRYNPRQ